MQYTKNIKDIYKTQPNLKIYILNRNTDDIFDFLAFLCKNIIKKIFQKPEVQNPNKKEKEKIGNYYPGREIELLLITGC